MTKLGPSSRATMSILQSVLADGHPANFTVRLWDGASWSPRGATGPYEFTLVLKHPGTLRQMLWPPNELTLAEAYIYDDIDVEGDLESTFPLADRLSGLGWGKLLKHGSRLLRLPRKGQPRLGRQAARLAGPIDSKERDRAAIAYHYDVSNDFFGLWLDRRMAYSCAYYATGPEDDLDTAQERKLEYVCRKLRLQRGERFLDIGCGWGGLITHAAERYGVEALGITLSRRQAEFVEARIRQAGLTDRCRVEIRDYRDLDGAEAFDKMASIGMSEHVPEARLADYFQRARRLLRPGGVFLNHAMTRAGTEPAHRGPSFMRRYVFPNFELAPLGATLVAAEGTGFEVRDVESLRDHYTLTSRAWCRRLERNHEAIRTVTDEATWRVWRLTTAGMAYRFSTGRQNVYQILLLRSDGGDSRLPLTRVDWYA